ncbi:MAG: SGNH/GDSL hydrolase family protein [bacterium]|nr:SGNH/GDSL hydrolase family protein [bacterium]
MSTITLVILGGLAFFIVYEVVRVIRHALVSKRLGREATIFSRGVLMGGKRILIIGDSTSYGTGTSDPAYSLAGRLASDMPEYAIENLSENAMSLTQLVEKLRTVEGPYARMFIHIGGVDTLALTPLHKVRRELTEALEQAQALTRGRVYLVSVNNPGLVPAFRFPLSWLFGRRSRQVSLVCDEACIARGVHHVPLWQRREHDPLLQAPERLFARDGLHPNDEGYGLWYQKIKQAL